MQISLAEHIRQTVPWGASDSELAALLDVRTLPRRGHLELSGRMRGTLVFVESGLLRLYSMDAQTRERTLEFGVEGCWLEGRLGFETGESPRWQAVEECRVVVFEPETYERLLTTYPDLERYFLRVFRRGEAVARRRSQLLAHLEGEERYHQFQRRYRHFVQRVPQYMLASFLGFTPEWLSKIRARKRPSR